MRRAASPAVLSNNYAHKSRFIQRGGLNLNSANSLAFVKGVDFNSQQKYDYNILNNQPLYDSQRAVRLPIRQQVTRSEMLWLIL